MTDADGDLCPISIIDIVDLVIPDSSASHCCVAPIASLLSARFMDPDIATLSGGVQARRQSLCAVATESGYRT